MGLPVEKIALITCEAYPRLTESERKLIPLLEQRGIPAQACVWDDPEVIWQDYTAWIVRSIWDYDRKAEKFNLWLDDLYNRIGDRFWNPYSVLRGNADKQYLQDLIAFGLPVLTTQFLKSPKEIPQALQSMEGEQFILKPSVSASAHHTYQFSRTEGERGLIPGLETWPEDKVPMLQPFIPQIAEEGEWSCIFLNGRFSHSVLKQPAQGDFRVQEEYGGNTIPRAASPELIVQAQAYVDYYGPDLLYARVDGVRIEGLFQLMELELIEPELFLHKSPEAHQRFADAIAERVL